MRRAFVRRALVRAPRRGAPEGQALRGPVFRGPVFGGRSCWVSRRYPPRRDRQAEVKGCLVWGMVAPEVVLKAKRWVVVRRLVRPNLYDGYVLVTWRPSRLLKRRTAWSVSWAVLNVVVWASSAEKAITGSAKPFAPFSSGHSRGMRLHRGETIAVSGTGADWDGNCCA